MEILKIRVPDSGQIKEFKVSPEMFEGNPAWRVVFEDGSEEIIGLDDQDSWRQLAGTQLDPALVMELGKAIEGSQEEER